ncbi:MAG TPA: phosphate ABC transporter substrate-binding protein [Thermoanaerobaculia bacterium]|nr:phosphate ABC transporter substrate-binding protein [Thermoanaerobaculia bacterium]
MLRTRLGLLLIASTFAISAVSAQPLRINGSTTVNPVVVEAAEILRAEKKATIFVDTQGGSSGGIAALGEGRAEIGMISRDLEPDDATKFPKVHFQATRIGTDALALVVSKDVWQGGVRILSRQQVQGIYEGTITNWKAVGGPDRRIVFFNKEPGRGTWEAFAKWLYGDPKKAPDVSHPEVGANEEGRNKVASTPGSISQLSAAWADQKTVFAVAIRRLDGKVVAPTHATIADGSYPIARPLQVVTDGPPKGLAKEMIDLLLSPRGQALVEKHGYLKAPAAGTKKK